MKVIDLTHGISQDMPVYPGTEPPLIITGCSIDDIGFLEKKITFYSHTGTHVDAPAHLLKNGKSLDTLPINHFFGKAVLLNLENMDDQTIDLNKLKPYQDLIRKAEFLLIQTGWSQFWGTETYFFNYPVLSLQVADWLTSFNLKGIGFDVISADKADSKDFQIHKIFLQKDIIIIENLTDLKKLPCHQFLFSCFPLSFEDADGSPVRAVAYIE